MDNKLSRLFDHQRFQQNPRLAKIIGDVEERYAGALSDDDLELVSAAGDADAGSDYITNTIFVDSQRTPPERPEDRTP